MVSCEMRFHASGRQCRKELRHEQAIALCDPEGVILVASHVQEVWRPDKAKRRFSLALTVRLLRISATTTVRGVFPPAQQSKENPVPEQVQSHNN